MNEVSESIDKYISRVLPQAKKELAYIKDNDWSAIENIETRENSYDVQALLVDRNVKTAINLYKIAKESDTIGSKRVKASLKLLISFFKICNERYESMVQNFDWTTLSMDDKKEATKAKLEIQIQSKILKVVNELEAKLQAINFGDESDDVNVSMYGDTPMPFLMRDVMESAFPVIGEYLERKNKK